MASAADMNHALRNKLIGLQGWSLVLLLWFSCLLVGVNPQELSKEEMGVEVVDALQALKRAWNTSTPDFDKKFENWNYSRPCGDLNSTDGERANLWWGVSCDFNNTWPTGVTVTELRLGNMGIVGVLPSDISKLSNLRTINLAGNLGISGPIPKELVQLRNLTYLRIGGNMFSGEFPFKSIINGSKLSYIDISINQFNGTIEEDAFRNLGPLEELYLASNKFIGQAPDVSNLATLRSLDLSQNGFTGPPPNMKNMRMMERLDLSLNNFTINPLSFFSFSNSLTYMNLSSNHLTGFSNGLLPFVSLLPQRLQGLDMSSVHGGVGFAPNFSDIHLLSSISTLYVDKNKFIGTFNITEFLESRASDNLKILSLKDNMITNIISPDTCIFTIVSSLPEIRLQGNPYCKSSKTTQEETKTCNFYCANTCFGPKKDRSILIIASSIGSVAVLVIFLVIVGFGFVLRGKEKYIKDLRKKIKEADVNAKRFDYNELRVATGNFAPEMKLGEGGYGAVYKGILASNVIVAVKQLLLNTYASREDFVNEVLLISNLQHQNLVALKGYCLNNKQTLLVYEYVDNCDLDKLLLSRKATMSKSTSQGLQLWKTRLKICQGVAQGLHYLHTFSQSRIIHRDIKASNILVNENFEAKIADFGLARLIEGSVIETSRCAGTFGYLAPEYASEGQLSEKADVYSFGVLLLEIVSGLRNRDRRMPEGEMHLANWASNLHKTKRLLDMKDPTLIVSEDEAEEVQQVLETAVLCLQNDPKKRPAMIQVAAMLALGKANGDALLPIDEELDNFLVDTVSEESDCDIDPFFDSFASTRATLGSRPACNLQIELMSLSKSGRLWRACGV